MRRHLVPSLWHRIALVTVHILVFPYNIHLDFPYNLPNTNMRCWHFHTLFSIINDKCREKLQPKRKPARVEISAPFDFKEGPAVNFPGYSSEDISLMREKAIASTAITLSDDTNHDLYSCISPSNELEFDLASRKIRPKSRASSYTCGLGQAGGRAVYHVRKVSRGIVYPSRISREFGGLVDVC